jgi:putative membrane protein
MKLKTIIILILVVLFVVIAIQNTKAVPIRILFWTISMSRIILIPLLMLIGFVVGFLAAQAIKK